MILHLFVVRVLFLSEIHVLFMYLITCPDGFNLFKVSNRGTETKSEIRLEIAITTLKQHC